MLQTTLGRITILALVMSLFCIGLFFIAAWSINDAINYQPALLIEAVDANEVSAQSFVVFDAHSGAQIASRNPAQQYPVASITKLLSAAMFYKDADLTATTTITWGDLNTNGDAGRLHYGETYGYRELLFPLLLESSNDAASAMLRVKPDLLQKMNTYVASLNLADTHFADTSGLSDQNVSTASELSILAHTLFLHDPHIFDITRLSQFIGTHTGWLNNNPLVHEEGFRGGKHGFTYEANRTVVAFFQEEIATGQERTIGYILLQSDSIPEDIKILRQEVQQKVRFE